jgi:hypothetical protein
MRPTAARGGRECAAAARPAAAPLRVWAVRGGCFLLGACGRTLAGGRRVADKERMHIKAWTPQARRDPRRARRRAPRTTSAVCMRARAAAAAWPAAARPCQSCKRLCLCGSIAQRLWPWQARPVVAEGGEERRLRGGGRSSSARAAGAGAASGRHTLCGPACQWMSLWLWMERTGVQPARLCAPARLPCHAPAVLTLLCGSSAWGR